MPVTKKTPAAAKAAPAKKTAAKKTAAKKANPEVVFGPPAFVDAQLTEAVKKFEKTALAMTKEAAQTLQAYHAGELVSVPTGFSRRHDFFHMVYPLLRLAYFTKAQWSLVKVLEAHQLSPNKRNENAVRKHLDALLDELDSYEAAPLSRAVDSAPSAAERKKAETAYYKLKGEQRRKRLGLAPAEFAKLLKSERAQYLEEEAKRKAKYAEIEARQAAEAAIKRKAKKAGKTLA